jgi:hypothetical protein
MCEEKNPFYMKRITHKSGLKKLPGGVHLLGDESAEMVGGFVSMCCYGKILNRFG